MALSRSNLAAVEGNLAATIRRLDTAIDELVRARSDAQRALDRLRDKRTSPTS